MALDLVLRWGATLCGGVGFAGVAFALFRLPPLERPSTGLRGEMRSRVIQQGGLFVHVEPLLLELGGWLRALGSLPIPAWQRWFRSYLQWQEHQLTLSGRVFGLDALELSALALVSSATLAGLVALARIGLDTGGVWIVPAALLGAALPNLRLQSATADRFKSATRSLPATLDLAALCMSAGADFTQALRYIVQGSQDVIGEELGRVLHSLEVGHTRKAALLELAERLPVEPVRDLVRALVQAEERGNPLAEVLQNQARMSRMRRSVAAEEAAARAGVLLILPMMLLLGCIVLLLLGPFIVTGGGL